MHTRSGQPTETRRRRPLRRAFLVIGLLAVSVNLRPLVAAVGPVLGDIRADLGLSATQAAVLTAAPVVCFGALAPVAPWLVGRLGLRLAVAVTVATVAAGLLVRLGPNLSTLYAGTVVASGGAAAGNVMLPALIKRDFAHRTGLMMGLYTTTLTLSAAVAAGTSAPLARLLGHGWRGALGFWALPAVLGLSLWLPHAGRRRPAAPSSEGAGLHTERPGALLRSRLAWHVTAYFGLQSLAFYAILSWLPTVFVDHGYSAPAAGLLLSLSAVVQAPFSLLLPVFAARTADQRGLVVAATAFATAGLAGLVVAPTAAPYLWVVILGIGQGASFPLGLMFVVLRTGEAHQTAALSAMAQTIGYLIAALGPLVLGALRDATGSWSPPLALLLFLLVPQLLTGLGAARGRV